MVTWGRRAAIGGITVTAVVALVSACGGSDGAGSDAGDRTSTRLLIDGPRGAGVWHHTPGYEQDAGSMASRRWLQGINDFTETVHSHGSESKAANSFVKDSPEKTSDVFPQVRPYDIHARMPGVDDVAYKCGTFEENRCVTWWAWARYGSYTVEFSYRRASGETQSLSDAQLATVVSNAGQDLAAEYRAL